MPKHSIETVLQPDTMDCGPACLCAIARYHGRKYSIQHLREHSFISREGVSMLGLADAADSIGMRTLSAKITLEQLSESMPLPCVLFWNHNHFVVCYDIKGREGKRRFSLMDPALGKVTYSAKEMRKHWISGKLDGKEVGIAMEVCPGEAFYDLPEETVKKEKGLSYFLRFILPHKRTYLHLLAGSFVVMLVGYCAPFLSQSMIDVGVKNRNLGFMLLIMAAQIVMAFSQTAIQFVQSWISLHMHTAIDIALVESYLNKLTRMPMRFFEIKTMGDILQRIGDHSRVKSFLMDHLVSSVFSLSTFIVFSVVLAIYNWQILVIFLLGNTFYLVWIFAFLKYRRKIDNKMFSQSAKLQNNMVQLIESMQEIKMYGIERMKLWEWKHLQAEIYKTSIMGMRIGQIQSSGSMLITTTTNILVSYLTARLVVTGTMTLGMMVALSFILGQVAGPIGSFINLILGYQDAKISLDRLNDVNAQEDEMAHEREMLPVLPEKGDINFQHVSFSYDGSARNFVLKDISLRIPSQSVTAIVGASGSGKTTLLKMIQGFYHPQEGVVSVGNTPIQIINPRIWRRQIGTVMQDGYIFSDTIARNVAVCMDEDIDKKKLLAAIRAVNLEDYVFSLPMNLSTKIGKEGIGLSQGQRQRILLARAIYRNPDFVILDEATNALDSQNERVIVENLQEFYKGKTVIVAAHRMSTIRNADHIVVLDNGAVVEQGTHAGLLAQEGYYYHLVKEQLGMAN